MPITRNLNWRIIIAFLLIISCPLWGYSCTDGKATDVKPAINSSHDNSGNEEGSQDTNNKPVASLSTSNTDVYVGTIVYIDGSQSYDPDGESVTPAWAMNKPDSSEATLVISDDFTCELTPDTPGTYSIILYVTDENGLKSESATISIVTSIDPVSGHDLRARSLSTVQGAAPGDSVFFDIDIQNFGEFSETIYVEITVSGPENSQTMAPINLGSIDAGTTLPTFNDFTSYTFPGNAPEGYYSFLARVFSEAGDENWLDNYSTATVYIGLPQIVETNAYKYEYKLIYWNDSLSLPDEVNAGGFGWLDYNGYQIAISPNITDEFTSVHIKNSNGVTLEANNRVYAGRAYVYDSGNLMVKYDMYAESANAVGIEVGTAAPGVVSITPKDVTGRVGQPVTMNFDIGGPGECCFYDEIFEHQTGRFFYDETNSDYHNTVISAIGSIENFGWTMEFTPMITGPHRFILLLHGENDIDFLVLCELTAEE